VVTALDIECFAEQLPEHLVVDLGKVVKGQTIHLDDLTLAPGIKVRTHGRKNPVIATVVDAVAEEIIVAPVASEEPAKGKKGKKYASSPVRQAPLRRGFFIGSHHLIIAAHHDSIVCWPG